MKIINCTPHTINVHPDGMNEVSLPASGIVPRVRVEQAQVGAISQ